MAWVQEYQTYLSHRFREAAYQQVALDAREQRPDLGSQSRAFPRFQGEHIFHKGSLPWRETLVHSMSGRQLLTPTLRGDFTQHRFKAIQIDALSQGCYQVNTLQAVFTGTKNG
jgi:hypothetical protein